MDLFCESQRLVAYRHSVICIDHFEETLAVKNINSYAVAIASSTNNYSNSKSNPSLLRTPTISRKSLKKRKIGVNELVLFQAADKIVDIDSISKQNSLENFTFKRLDNGVKLFNLNCITIV